MPWVRLPSKTEPTDNFGKLFRFLYETRGVGSADQYVPSWAAREVLHLSTYIDGVTTLTPCYRELLCPKLPASYPLPHHPPHLYHHPHPTAHPLPHSTEFVESLTKFSKTGCCEKGNGAACPAVDSLRFSAPGAVAPVRYRRTHSDHIQYTVVNIC